MTKSMKTSGSPVAVTAGRRDQGLVVIPLVLVAIVLFAIAIILFAAAKSSHPSQSTTPPLSKSVDTSTEEITATPSATPTPSWQTYSNSEYGFSIRYPCQTCSSNRPEFESDQGGGSIVLPTLNVYTQLVLEVFTRQGTAERSIEALTPGPGQPYPYAIDKFERELTHPPAQSCQWYAYSHT